MAVVGKILLGILILLLFLLIAILFCPFSYQVKGRKNAEGFFISAKVKWLFGFVRVLFDFPEPKTPILKIAFFTLTGKKKKQKKAKTEAAPSSEEPSAKVEESAKEEPAKEEFSKTESQETLPSEAAPSGKENSKAENENSPEKESSKKEPIKKEAKEDKKQKKQKEKSKEKVPLSEKLAKLKDEVSFYKELWEDGNTKPLLKATLHRVFHVLRNLLPRKIRGSIVFGGATPDVTGYVYGGYVVGKALYPKKVLLELTPDFENKILEGNLEIKGHFTIFTILWDGLRILFDKRLKILRQKLKERKAGQNPTENQGSENKTDQKSKKKPKKKAKKAKGNTNSKTNDLQK